MWDRLQGDDAGEGLGHGRWTRRGRGLRVAAILALAGVISMGCEPDDSALVRLYKANAYAPSLDPAAIAAMDHMGPLVVDQGTNFAVFSANATRMDVLLFDDPESSRATRTFEMARIGDIWNVHIEGVGYGQHYGYVAWGPNWPYDPKWIPGRIDGFKADVDAAGNRFNPNKLLIDPYAKAVHRDHDWSKGSTASGPGRTQSTYAAAAKSVVVRSNYTWSEGEAAWRTLRRDASAPGNGWNEQIIYEVHLKGFTADPSSGVLNPGTFRGFGEAAAYLGDLGITAVHLLPTHEKPLDGGYWGYNNINYFAPEFSYSAARDPLLIIDEFKWMVDQLHQYGVEVWLDVVYNHTGEGGLWREKLQGDDVDIDPITSADLASFDPKEVAGLYSFRGLDNQSYYALSPDNQTYWYATGVGNQLRTNNPPVRRLILDSLRWAAEELHIDGFRFDLAPALGAVDGDYQRWDDSGDSVLEAIADDPLLVANNVRLVAEPWAAGGDYGFMLGRFPASTIKPEAGWYEWNGRFRDWWRSFINEDDWTLSSTVGDADGGFSLTGFDRYFSWNGRRPYHSVNFITVHDGFTLYDNFSYWEKRNGCGPLNPVCCDNPLSVWCDNDSGENHNRSRDWGSDNEPTKRQMMRNAFVAMMIAHGTPLILGGDEWMRTQLGNNNAYSTNADNPFNWYQWGSWRASEDRVRMHDFVRQLTRFRRERVGKLSPVEYGTGAPFAWKSAQGVEPPDWNSRQLMIHYYDDVGGPPLLILINMERGAVNFSLPPEETWLRLVDTQDWFDREPWLTEDAPSRAASGNIELDAPVTVDTNYELKGSSIVILEALR